MTQNRMQEFYNLTYKFNEIAGKLDNVKLQDCYKQLQLVREELEETFHAYQVQDYEGLLDGAADLSVVVQGLVMMLDKLGFETQDALIATAENNLSKFLDGKETTRANASVKALSEQGVTTHLSYNPQYNVFVIKDENNKIRKPVGFVSNNLSKFVPKEVV